MTAPAVSVLMSVHDGAPWVADAVASVLAQTAGNLELIVVDDGSTDATPDLLAAVRDPRLRVMRQARTGLTRALNRALGAARGALVARLDADDVALPERLARQRAFLQQRPDVGLLGSAAREIDADGALVRVVQPPAEDSALRRALIRANPFVHSSIVVRRALLERAGGYDETLAVAQDYDLWMRLARVTRLANLPEVLVVRRLDQAETCRLPWPDAAFDLVLAVGVVEHLPVRHRRQQVDEYYRVLARGGHIAILDTPNRWFPLETHSVGLPLVQWLPAPIAWRYARWARRDRYGTTSYAEFIADGTGWRNATLAECLPSWGRHGLVDVTEEAGYGWRFFRDTARSHTRRAVLPIFAAAAALLRTLGRPPSLALPYFNLLFRKS